MQRYYISGEDFRGLVNRMFRKEGETVNLNWHEGFKDIEEGWYRETEPLWLGSVYASGQSELGVDYTRIIWDETTEDPTGERGFLRCLADGVKLDDGLLKLICTSQPLDSYGWPQDQVLLCYEE